MSRFDDLVAQLCPDGVPSVPVGDLLDYEQPGKYLVTSTAYDASYPTPVLTAGQTFILGYTNETDGIYSASPTSPVMIFDDFTTAFKWVSFPFKAKSSAMKMLTPKAHGLASLRYVYYAMQMIKYVPKDHARQWIGKYSRFRIPLPPVDVQREIVRILDLFGDLEAELNAERDARQAQYEHYRDALLAFPGSAAVQRTPMGELGQFVRGNGLQKSDLLDGGMPAIHYGQVHTTYGVWTAETKSFVSPEFGSKLRRANPGDLVIATTSEDDEAVGKAVAWIGDKEAAISGDAYVYRHCLDPKFVAYFFQTGDFQRQKRRGITGTKVRRISGDALAKHVIPVPERSEQERIVGILDKLYMLVNDVSVGLPAELTLRRAQYRHYRDRLLTFREAVA